MSRYFSLLLFSLLIVACGGPEGTEVSSSDAVAEMEEGTSRTVPSKQYVVDPESSVVNWEGSKLVGGGHTGTIPIVFGQIATAEDKIIGGRFTMDLRELTNTDLAPDEGGDKLIGHLKSADFFDVEKYPRAEFNITQVQAAEGAAGGVTHNISGNLTMKGQSRNITIPAIVSIDGSQLKATTIDFVIDRTEWGMEYGSDGIAGLAQDKIINNNVGLQLMLVANE